MAATVLIIDDDNDFSDLLSEYLQREGFLTEAAYDGKSGYQAALKPNIDIVILDVMLPHLNGFDVLASLKSKTSIPVLMLSAKGEEADQLNGLNIGADDYLSKPCSPRLIAARLRAILRRSELVSSAAAEELMVDNIKMNLTKRLVSVETVEIELTNSEYNILSCLMKEAGKILSKEVLSKQALNKDITIFDRSLDMHISHLRNKFDEIGVETPKIRTIRGIGYVLEGLKS